MDLGCEGCFSPRPSGAVKEKDASAPLVGQLLTFARGTSLPSDGQLGIHRVSQVR